MSQADSAPSKTLPRDFASMKLLVMAALPGGVQHLVPRNGAARAVDGPARQRDTIATAPTADRVREAPTRDGRMIGARETKFREVLGTKLRVVPEAREQRVEDGTITGGRLPRLQRGRTRHEGRQGGTQERPRGPPPGRTMSTTSRMSNMQGVRSRIACRT